MECSKVAKEYDVTMISDGGHCGKVGNKFKALAVGSGCVLLGKSLAGTKESPGNIIYKSGKRFKYYRGMASMYANLSKQERTGGDLNKNFYVEGIEGEVEYKGNVIDELNRICNGMRSGMSYLGVRTISELHETEVVFNRVTSSGLNETLTRL
jgi:IMP dehydrogenase